MSNALLQVRGLRVEYRARAFAGERRFVAVHDVSFDLSPAGTLGIVGESGSGKSSIARAILRLTPAQGSVRFGDTELLDADRATLRATRRRLQAIFQDPVGSLNPRMSVGAIVGEPLLEHRPELSAASRHEQVVAALARVGLGADVLARRPREFSGGQAQRIAIARALILGPELIVCDEPLSALDVSIKAQIANLLRDLQRQLRLSQLIISHDLAAVRYCCDDVLVLYGGQVMEMAPTAELFSNPRHPYTRTLLASVPTLEPAPIRIGAPTVTSSAAWPSRAAIGCAFSSRCPVAIARCREQRPALRSSGSSDVACHLVDATRS